MGMTTVTMEIYSLTILALLLALFTSGSAEESGSQVLNPDIWSMRSSRDRRDTHAHGHLDLHSNSSGEFCVDVSKYGIVKFKPTNHSKCETTFVKRCEPKSEEVCVDVTEIQCEVVPYTECEMVMLPTPYKTFEMDSRIFPVRECNETTEKIKHTKMVPECRNVTKQNCVTNWETDADGNQVWTGNEDCEPVTWRDCVLVPRHVDFKVPKINCFTAHEKEIPYTIWVDTVKTQMTTSMTCKVKHSTNCRPVVSRKCGGIKYQECKEESEVTCHDHDVMIPYQELVHKKKCLLPDVGAAIEATGADVESSTTAAVVRTESEPEVPENYELGLRQARTLNVRASG